MSNHEQLLLDFLKTPLDCGDRIFDRFASLPGAVFGKGSKSLQRYVYIPGGREDRIVLVSHTDTIWDKAYKNSFSGETPVEFRDGIFVSTNPAYGIGADDRAGCAMLWELRDCGHSILIVDGEEYGKRGARFLRNSNRRLFRELNRHCYMIELDWIGTDTCLFHQVDNTKTFKRYIEKSLGVTDSRARGGCDLQILCGRVCGVNLGIGYHGFHSGKEHLVLSEWENTLEKLRTFLQTPQTRFRVSFLAPYWRVIRFAKRCINKAQRVAKGLRKKYFPADN